MFEFLVVGAMSFIAGTILSGWVFLKVIRFMKRRMFIQNVAVVYDATRKSFAQFCVDLRIPYGVRHFHSRLEIHPELAEELIAGMHKHDHPDVGDIHEHMTRGRGLN